MGIKWKHTQWFKRLSWCHQIAFSLWLPFRLLWSCCVCSNKQKKNREVCFAHKPLPCSSCHCGVKQTGKNSIWTILKSTPHALVGKDTVYSHYWTCWLNSLTLSEQSTEALNIRLVTHSNTQSLVSWMKRIVKFVRVSRVGTLAPLRQDPDVLTTTPVLLVLRQALPRYWPHWEDCHSM